MFTGFLERHGSTTHVLPLFSVHLLPGGHEALEHALGIGLEIGNPPQVWKTYQALGALCEQTGEYGQAQASYADAIRVIEAVADHLQDQDLKHTFLAARPVQEIRDSLERIEQK